MEPLFLKLEDEAKNLEQLPTRIVVTMASRVILYLATESTGVIQLIPAMKVPGVGEAQVKSQLTLTPLSTLLLSESALVTVCRSDYASCYSLCCNNCILTGNTTNHHKVWWHCTLTLTDILV